MGVCRGWLRLGLAPSTRQPNVKAAMFAGHAFAGCSLVHFLGLSRLVRGSGGETFLRTSKVEPAASVGLCVDPGAMGWECWRLRALQGPPIVPYSA